MTGRRVLNSQMAPVASDPAAKAEVEKIMAVEVKIAPGNVINNLQQIAIELHEIEKLNDQMRGQFAVGSAAWHTCESIDDKLSEIYKLLGE